MKFVHVSDTHLGCKSPLEYSTIREKDFLSAFEQVIKISIEKNVDFIIHTGDFFDERYSIPPDLLIKIVDLLVELKKRNIPIYVIKGNHDLKKTNGYLLKMLDKVGLINLLEPGKEKIERDEYIIYGISEPRDIAKDHITLYYKTKFSKISIEGDKFKILMSHTVPKEFQIPFQDPHLISISNYPKNFDYYAFGHIHFPFIKEIDGKYYVLPGSTERCEISEKESRDKGVILFKDGELKFIKLKIRPIKIIDMSILDDISLDRFRREIGATDKSTIVKIKALVSKKTKDSVRKIVSEYRALGGLVIYEEFERGLREYSSDLKIEETNETFEEILVRKIREEVMKVEKENPKEIENFIFELLDLQENFSKDALKKRLLSKYYSDLSGYKKRQKTLFDIWA